MTVEENEVCTASKELLQVNLQDIADPLNSKTYQSSQDNGTADKVQRENNHSGYLQVQRDMHAIEVAENGPKDAQAKQQSGTGYLYQQRGRNQKLSQDQPSEGLLKTLQANEASLGASPL